MFFVGIMVSSIYCVLFPFCKLKLLKVLLVLSLIDLWTPLEVGMLAVLRRNLTGI